MKSRVAGIEPNRRTKRHLPRRSKWMSLCIFVCHFDYDNTIHSQFYIESIKTKPLSQQLTHERKNLVDI